MYAFRNVVTLLTFFIGILLAAPPQSGAEIRLKVVASIPPLADFAREVGGSSAEVTTLLPPGASPHTFEPSPRMMQVVADARVFIKAGAGLEFWADRMIAAANSRIAVVDASKGIDLLRYDGGSHDHGGADPHYWLDPIAGMTVVSTIEEAFAAADPGRAALYRKNAAAYRERLSSLDREIAATVKTFRTRDFVTFHPAWNYFARRYGLTVAGVIEESPGKDPSPRQIERILAAVRKLRSRVIFAEPQFSTRVAEAIAREAGGRVLLLDPEGGVKGRETYIALMRYNLSVMAGAMR